MSTESLVVLFRGQHSLLSSHHGGFTPSPLESMAAQQTQCDGGDSNSSELGLGLKKLADFISCSREPQTACEAWQVGASVGNPNRAFNRQHRQPDVRGWKEGTVRGIQSPDAPRCCPRQSRRKDALAVRNTMDDK